MKPPPKVSRTMHDAHHLDAVIDRLVQDEVIADLAGQATTLVSPDRPSENAPAAQIAR
jgi:hypothetical protein